MPVERSFPLAQVLRVVESFSRRVTFEYVMIDGVNDRPDDVFLLAEIARPLGALVNLLPLHPGRDGRRTGYVYKTSHIVIAG